MAGIKGKNTRNEILVRKALFAKGFRYRINVGSLPGKPDIVFPKHRAVIMIHGCFWHGHECKLFRLPKTRTGYWHKKIAGNKERDIRNRDALANAGWRVATVWECSLRGKSRDKVEDVILQLENWLSGEQQWLQISQQGLVYI